MTERAPTVPPASADPGASDTSDSSDSSDTKAMASIARGGAASLLGSGVSAASQLVVVLIVTRWYSPADAGALFAATAAFFIAVAVVQLGTDQGLVRFVAAHLARGEHHELRRILRIGLAPVVGASILGAAVVFALAGPLGDLLGDDGGDRTAQMMRVLAVAIPIAAIHEAVLAATRGLGSLRSTIIVERIVRPVLQPIAIATVAIGDLGTGALAPAWAGPYVVALIGSAVALRSALHRAERASAAAHAEHAGAALVAEQGIAPVRAEQPIAADRAQESKLAVLADQADAPVLTERAGSVAGTVATRSLGIEFWSFTSGRAVSRIFQVALQRVDVLLIAAMVGPSAVAIYTAATRFIAVGMLANQAIQQVIQPRLAAMLARDQLELVRHVLQRTTVWLVALVWPGYLALAVLAPTFMRIFGAEYETGAASLAILSLAMLFASAAGPLDVALLMAGRSAVSLLNMSVALAVDVVGCLLLLPPFGVTGAAIAWALAIVVRNVLTVAQAHRLLGLTATSRKLLEVSAYGVACCAVLPVPLALLGAPAIVTASALLVGLVVYLALLFRRRSSLGLNARLDAVPAAA